MNLFFLNCMVTIKIACRIGNVYLYVTAMTGSQNPSAVVREVVTRFLIINQAKDSHRATTGPTYHWISPSMDVFVIPSFCALFWLEEFACDDKLDDIGAFLSGEIIKIRKEMGEEKYNEIFLWVVLVLNILGRKFNNSHYSNNNSTYTLILSQKSCNEFDDKRTRSCYNLIEFNTSYPCSLSHQKM